MLNLGLNIFWPSISIREFCVCRILRVVSQARSQPASLSHSSTETWFDFIVLSSV